MVLPPPQEAEEEEEWITDDWAYSSLYQYVYQSHYEKLVSKKLVNYSVLEASFASRASAQYKAFSSHLEVVDQSKQQSE